MGVTTPAQRFWGRFRMKTHRSAKNGVLIPTDLLDGGFASNFKLVRDQIGQVHMRDLFVEEYPWLMAYEGDSPRTGP